MRKINSFYLVLFSVAATFPAKATQPQAASDPIVIKADHLLAEQKKGLATYTGHVVAQQGQFFLYGERLEVYVKDGKIQQVIAYGTPTKFKKYDTQAKGWIHGQARQIIYEPIPQKQLKLQQSAQVTQATGETLLSEQIQYLVDSKTLKAVGSEHQRVHVILPAQEKQ